MVRVPAIWSGHHLEYPTAELSWNVFPAPNAAQCGAKAVADARLFDQPFPELLAMQTDEALERAGCDVGQGFVIGRLFDERDDDGPGVVISVDPRSESVAQPLVQTISAIPCGEPFDPVVRL